MRGSVPRVSALLMIVVAPAHGAESSACDEANRHLSDACLIAQADRADADEKRYEAMARMRLRKDAASEATLRDFDAAAKAWTTYRRRECDAVYESWGFGTARFAENASCSIDITRARTHELWSRWLTNFGGAPPDLPEPPLR